MSITTRDVRITLPSGHYLNAQEIAAAINRGVEQVLGEPFDATVEELPQLTATSPYDKQENNLHLEAGLALSSFQSTLRFGTWALLALGGVNLAGLFVFHLGRFGGGALLACGAIGASYMAQGCYTSAYNFLANWSEDRRVEYEKTKILGKAWQNVAIGFGLMSAGSALTCYALAW